MEHETPCPNMLNLDSICQNRLNITTSDGNKFQSDFVSALKVQDKRIYISNESLPGWLSNGFDPTNKYACLTSSYPVDPLNELVFTHPDTAFGPWTFATPDLITYLVIAPKSCLDCRYQGGTNVQPSFWPPYD